MHYAIIFSCLGALVAIAVWAFVTTRRRKHLYFNQKLNFLQKNLEHPPFKNFELEYEFQQYLINQCFKKESISLLILKIMQHLKLPFEIIDVVLTVEEVAAHAPAKTTAGQYVRSGVSHNKIYITLKQEYSLYEILAIVCHECTHHYLFSRNIKEEPEDENEKLTDITAVYLGFGKYLSYGYKPMERIVGEKFEGGVHTIQKEISHLGYIDLEQIQYLQKKTDKLRKQNEKEFKKEAQALEKREAERREAAVVSLKLEEEKRRLVSALETAQLLYDNNLLIVERLREGRNNHITPEDITVLQENILAYENGEIALALRQLRDKATDQILVGDEAANLRGKVDYICGRLALWNATLSKYGY